MALDLGAILIPAGIGFTIGVIFADPIRDAVGGVLGMALGGGGGVGAPVPGAPMPTMQSKYAYGGGDDAQPPDQDYRFDRQYSDVYETYYNHTPAITIA